jgi:hypothetical protein
MLLCYHEWKLSFALVRYAMREFLTHFIMNYLFPHLPQTTYYQTQKSVSLDWSPFYTNCLPLLP